MDRQTTGIYHKFNVTRVDGSDQPGHKHDGCRYFVLDLTHDKHAPAAMAAYAESCREKYPALADDCASYATSAGYTDERDHLRADVERLRERVEFWEATEKLADKTRDDLHEAWSALNNSHVIKLREVIDAANAAELTAAGLRRAMEEIANDKVSDISELTGQSNDLLCSLCGGCHRDDCPVPIARAALAASPDDHARRIKAEEARRCAEVVADIATATRDVSHPEWVKAVDSVAETLADIADRLEAENG